jgi:hypothetical protein
MANKDDETKPREQFAIGAFIASMFIKGTDDPRDAHSVGDFDVSMIPDFAFWASENGGFISEVSHGQWEALIERLEGIGKDLLWDKAWEHLDKSWKTFKGWALGEPHNCSFRGVGFDFQARGEFTYARTRSGDEEFRIDVRHKPIGNHAAVIDSVAVKLGPLVIEVSTNRVHPTVAGKPIDIGFGGVVGFKTNEGKYLGALFEKVNCCQIIDQNMNVVQMDRVSDHYDVYILLNQERAADASGVLGNPVRGLLRLDGTPLPPKVSPDEMRRFASDWSVKTGQTLFTDGAVVPYDPKSPERFLTVADLDAKTRSRAEAVSREQLGASADPFLLDACIYDVGFAGELYRSSYGVHTLPAAVSRLVIAR